MQRAAIGSVELGDVEWRARDDEARLRTAELLLSTAKDERDWWLSNRRALEQKAAILLNGQLALAAIVLGVLYTSAKPAEIALVVPFVTSVLITVVMMALVTFPRNFRWGTTAAKMENRLKAEVKHSEPIVALARSEEWAQGGMQKFTKAIADSCAAKARCVRVAFIPAEYSALVGTGILLDLPVPPVLWGAIALVILLHCSIAQFDVRRGRSGATHLPGAVHTGGTGNAADGPSIRSEAASRT